MLFMVEMHVRLPPDMPGPEREALLEGEREYSQRLQGEGRWVHLWRVAGRFSNVSIFDVGSPEELHELMSGRPLYPYTESRITALARHPSAIDRDAES